MKQAIPKLLNPLQRMTMSSSPSPSWASAFLSLRMLLGAALLAVCCILSFCLGRYSIPDGIKDSISLSELTYVFQYNRTFGEAPSPGSEAAWSAIFPEYGGYITHPELAQTRSAIAVFHQLHCLNSIRKSFWAAYDAAQDPPTDLTSAHRSALSHVSPAHVRHCVDLLRQRLMCQPDLTMEKLNEELGGVTGFGTAHQCKDWGQLYDFAGEWEYYGMDREKIAQHKALLGSQHSHR